MAEVIKTAIIGAGGRCRKVAGKLQEQAAGQVEITAVYDPDRTMVERFCRELNLPMIELTDSPEAAINRWSSRTRSK